MLCRTSLVAISFGFLLAASASAAEDAPKAPAPKAPAVPAPAPAPAPQPGAPVEGTIKDISRDEFTATGSITIVDNSGNATTYGVNVATVFELVRGMTVIPSNFLREHRGEKARIFPVTAGDYVGVLKVQILLPPTVKRLYPIHGKVIEVTADTITIQAPIHHHHKPPEPVVGVVKDVSFDANTELGTMTVKVRDKWEKYTVTPWTRFVKVKDGVHKPTNFLQEFRGETVVVFPYAADSNLVRQVDIILSGPAMLEKTVKEHVRKYREAVAHQYTFQVNAATVYEFVRDGKHFPAQFSNVAVGEWVGILPTGFHSGVAKHVNIHLPHALHGEVVDVAAAALTLRVHRPATLEWLAHDAILTVPLMPSTKYETVEDMVTQTVAFSALKKGEHVVVFRTAVPPHPAEKVAIHLHHKLVATRGILSSMADSGAFSVTVKHPAKDGKPAGTSQEKFQTTPTTVIVAADSQQPTIANVGDDVTVYAHHHKGAVSTAEKIEVRVVAPTAITAHGALVSTANGAVSINVKKGGKGGKGTPAMQESFQLTAATVIVLASNQQPTTLMPGDELTIHAHSRGGVVGPAEKIEVRRKKGKGK